MKSRAEFHRYLILFLPVVFVTVENLAFAKAAWMSDGRSLKRHALHRGSTPLEDATVQWRRGGQAARAVDGVFEGGTGCAVLDSIDTERPAWMVDLGRKTTVAGAVIVIRIEAEAELGIIYK
jgi:hypothetical protein